MIKNNVPKYVYDDLIVAKNLKNEYNELCLFALLQAEKEQISSVFGCSEGLENKLKNKIYTSYEDLISKVTAKRYTASRIKRILCANLLKLNEKDCRLFLQSELYLKPLALKKERHNEILAALSKSNYPTIILKKNLNGLNKTALKCFNACEFADEIWDFIFKTSTYNYTFLQI